MSKPSPTSRTLQALRAEGWTCQVTERYCSHSHRRIDLFGCIDVLAIRAGSPVLAVQATSGPNHASRVTKAVALPALRVWLQAGGAFEVWSWRKAGPRGRAKRWQVRRQPITLADLPAEASADTQEEKTDHANRKHRPRPGAPAAGERRRRKD